jgi:putative endopeptidase
MTWNLKPWGFSLALALLVALPPAFVQAQSALETTAMDTSIRVQDDLYLHVNGNWLRNTEIPADKSNYGSFIKLDDLSRDRIRTIVEKAAAETAPAGSDAQKVGDFYKSYMDTDRIASLDYQPVQSELEKIAALKSHEDVARYFGYCGTIGVQSPMGLFIGVDEKDSTRYLTSIIQSGTTLPDRDYYLKDDPKYTSSREALVAYVNKLFSLINDSTENPGEKLVALEKQIAEIQWPRTDLRDALKTYNKFALQDFGGKTTQIPWKSYLEGAQTPAITELNVMTPSYFEKFSPMFTSIDVATWKLYLRYKLLDAYAEVLGPAFDDAHFELHGKTLAGIPQQLPRWKRGVDAISGKGAGDFGTLGDVVGRLYVSENFKPEAKARMDQLVKNLLAAFGQSVDELAWMTDETKVKAKEKLSKITTKIGYPDKWRDYEGLTIKADDLVGNLKRSAQFEYQRMVKKLGQPVDRLEWGMTPQTVNAYYNPTLNEIVFPAAILQPPFFGVDAADALNYGGIGAVIGHEISHAFDDQGSRYDGAGNLNNWWTDADRKSFEELTKRLIAQYAEYEPLPGKKVNGEFTLGENIADLSGLAIAYKAFQISKNGKEPEKVAGYTSNQLFFVGWSRVWQRKYRDDEMIRRLVIDPHSPSQYRANGPVTNIDAFYDAFGVKEGDLLFKPVSERIRIW